MEAFLDSLGIKAHNEKIITNKDIGSVFDGINVLVENADFETAASLHSAVADLKKMQEFQKNKM